MKYKNPMKYNQIHEKKKLSWSKNFHETKIQIFLKKT
jgi:hypothetical protein